MLRFAEEIMLLLLDDKGGSFINTRSALRECALAGAVLMDLALEGRIDTDPEPRPTLPAHDYAHRTTSPAFARGTPAA